MTESLHVQVGDNKNVLIGSMGNMTVLLPLHKKTDVFLVDQFASDFICMACIHFLSNICLPMDERVSNSVEPHILVFVM